MPKLSIGTDTHRFLSGAGVAVAIPTGMFTDSVSYWFNADVAGYKYRADNGFTLFLSVGLSVGLGGGDYHRLVGDADPDETRDILGFTMPQGRLGLGYSRWAARPPAARSQRPFCAGTASPGRRSTRGRATASSESGERPEPP